MNKKDHTVWARMGTEVFSPFVLLGVLLAVVAFTTDRHPWLAAAVSLVFIVGIPQALSIAMTRRGTVTDRFIVRREQRHRFYALCLVSVTLGGLVLVLLPVGSAIVVSVWVCVGVLLVVALINLRVKISVHALTAAFVAIAVSAFLGWTWLIPGTLVTIWVCLSRIVMDKHTVGEVLLGVAGGIATCAAYLSLLPG